MPGFGGGSVNRREAGHELIDNQFIAEVRRDMLRFAQLQLRDASLAEDAVQEEPYLPGS